MSNDSLINKIIELAIEEDIATGDITTNALIPETSRAIAEMTMKADGIISGLDIAKKVFEYFDKEILWTSFVKEGDNVKKGDIILKVEGSYRCLLTAERTALNILQRMSGIATATALYVKELEGSNTKLLDTRKTAPGMRILDKMAVKAGGGTNHRMGLYDLALIKDNHIKVAGGISNAVKQVQTNISSGIRIEVEVTNLEEVKEALDSGADIIMLDNMSTAVMAKAVKMISGKAETEASGNMTISRIKEVASTGVDYISVGALTHSVTALDISMNIKSYDIVKEINRLKKEKNAVILAHFYVRQEVQDIADYIGDSLGLSNAASKTEADIILFCGVNFMAETASIISPNKKVLVPDNTAGCSLAESIEASDLLEWKNKNPEGVIVSYVNTTAEIKAYSDICCTSSNALKVVMSIPGDKKILFVPDKNLGNYIRLKTGRDLEIWDGDCCVHNRFDTKMVMDKSFEYPGADILIHPESKCSNDPAIHNLPQAYFYSTSGMIKHVNSSPKNQFIVVTEAGVIYEMQKNNPGKEFIPIHIGAICRNMKKVTLEKVLHSLQTEQYEIKVPVELREKAWLPIQRMLEIK